MKKMTMWVAVALMTVTVVVGCTSDDVTMQEPQPVENPTGNDTILSNEDNEYKYIELTRGEQQLVSHNNEFAFNLFRKLAAEEQSVIVSPISITYALGMLNNGAAGETQAQINKVKTEFTAQNK